MQYSSPLISSKLWAELATYVRKLCKISDRAHAQNLTERELQDNDKKKVGGRMDWKVKETITETYSASKLVTHVSCAMSLSEHGVASTRRQVVSVNNANNLFPRTSTPYSQRCLRTPQGQLRRAKYRNCCCRRAHISTTCPFTDG